MVFDLEDGITPKEIRAISTSYLAKLARKIVKKMKRTLSKDFKGSLKEP